MVGEYCLGGSYVSTAGLNLQYSLIQRLLNGRVLEPSIPFRDKNLMIADIPCGTCMWLIDLSSQAHSSSNLHGFDINLKQGPPDPWLPSNVMISTLNLFQKPPPSLVGQYDIVHVSLTVCFVDDTNIRDVIQNLTSLLKPGGYIQWLEMAIDETRFESAVPGYHPTALPAAVEKLWDMVGWKSPNWPRNLGNLLSSAGLDSVVTTLPPDNNFLGRAFADGELLGMEPTFIVACAARPELANEVDYFRVLALRAAEEVREKGVGCFPTLILVTARKPLALVEV